MLEHMGFNLRAASFDAKSRHLVVKGSSMQPLTVFELQRKVQRELQPITKKTELRTIIADYIDSREPSGEAVPTLAELSLRALIGYHQSVQLEQAVVTGRKKVPKRPKFTRLVSKIPIPTLKVIGNVEI